LLRGLIERDPDYPPARYNVALWLEQSFRDAESRAAWQEYLSRKSPVEFEVAERHLQGIQ